MSIGLNKVVESDCAYYYREYVNGFNGIESKNNYVQRCKCIAQVIIPFISLYSPVNRYISIAMGGVRSVSCLSSIIQEKDNKVISIFNCAFAVASCAMAIFKHPLSGVVISCHEIIYNSLALRMALWAWDYQSAIESTLFLANNSLYLATLFYCSLEVVLLSLALQMVVQGYRAFKEFQKGNLLEGYAHALMGAVRFYQTQLLWESLCVKWLIKADIEQWKDRLSPYEKAVKDLLGEKFLYFKKNDKQEKFLILSAEEDEGKAFHPWIGELSSIIKNLSERFDVKFCKISKVEDIEREIRLAAEAGRVTGLMLRAHGSHLSMHLGPDSTSGVLNAKTIRSTMFSSLDPDCVIVLDSCETAKYPDSSIAYDIANQSQRVTYAADCILKTHTDADLRLVSLNPLEWRFDFTDLENTKKIFPQTVIN